MNSQVASYEMDTQNKPHKPLELRMRTDLIELKTTSTFRHIQLKTSLDLKRNLLKYAHNISYRKIECINAPAN